MAATGPLIVKVPQGIEIRGRRRVNTPAELETLLDNIQNNIVTLQEQDENAVLTVWDCDLSQNKLPAEQFENLFAVFSGANVKVQRFRLFGCPTINDQVMKTMGEYFKMLSADSVPSELHLSDCSITAEGFAYLMAAIEESDSFPTLHPVNGKRTPLYLRLENNFIDEAAIQEKVDAGIIRPFMKKPNQWRSGTETAKVDLIVQGERQYKQKIGAPPAPEEVTMFKDVFDKYSQQNQAMKGACGKGAMGAMGANGKGGWQQPWQQAGWQQAGAWGKGMQQWPAMMIAPRPGFGWQQPGKGGPRPGGPATIVPRPVQMQTGPRPVTPRPVITPRPIIPTQQSFGKGAGKGATPVGYQRPGGMAADRSRTPVTRAAPPRAPPPGKEKPLPYPWEEHWSDEYGIPYFWNSETGDSLWERPTK